MFSRKYFLKLSQFWVIKKVTSILRNTTESEKSCKKCQNLCTTKTGQFPEFSFLCGSADAAAVWQLQQLPAVWQLQQLSAVWQLQQLDYSSTDSQVQIVSCQAPPIFSSAHEKSHCQFVGGALFCCWCFTSVDAGASQQWLLVLHNSECWCFTIVVVGASHQLMLVLNKSGCGCFTSVNAGA